MVAVSIGWPSGRRGRARGTPTGPLGLPGIVPSPRPRASDTGYVYIPPFGQQERCQNGQTANRGDLMAWQQAMARPLAPAGVHGVQLTGNCLVSFLLESAPWSGGFRQLILNVPGCCRIKSSLLRDASKDHRLMRRWSVLRASFPLSAGRRAHRDALGPPILQPSHSGQHARRNGLALRALVRPPRPFGRGLRWRGFPEASRRASEGVWRTTRRAPGEQAGRLPGLSAVS